MPFMPFKKGGAKKPAKAKGPIPAKKAGFQKKMKGDAALDMIGTTKC